MADNQYIEDVIYTYAGMVLDSGQNLILATQSGIISGMPVFKGDKVSKMQETFFEAFDEDRKSSKTEYAQSITLKDVQISSSNVSYKLPYLTIFMDKILGVSIGSLE